jgi:hypothetical protein
MALKPRYKRRIFWSIIITLASILLISVIVPQFITLNSFKSVIEQSVHKQTNVPLKLNGDIHFSLIGGTTIVAHDVDIPDAKIGSVLFSIPFHSFFNLQDAQLNDAVVIYDADINIKKLTPAFFNHNIEIYNSDITLYGKKFHIIRADFTNDEFHGVIRSTNHKYEVEFINDTFNIKNKTNKLDLSGQFYSDGTIRGHMDIETKNINKWFGFDEPTITHPVKLTTNFEWDGGNGYSFTNLNANGFSGNITVSSTGDKTIQLVSNDANIDLSFLSKPTNLLNKTTFNLDFYGHIKFMNHIFEHLKIDVIASNDTLQITNIIADNIIITGGQITQNGAKDIMITMPVKDTNAMCLFSGTPSDWQCSKFTYGDLYGSISVKNNIFDINIQSNNPMPKNTSEYMNMVYKLGNSGTIKFKFSNIGGTYKIDNKTITPTYDFANSKTLKWLNINIPFLPKYMLHDIGNFTWQNNMLTFTPDNKQWELSTYSNYFYISGDSIKKWFPNLDFRFLNDSKYTISGHYNKNQISNLKIEMFGHEFTGSVSNKHLTLHTDILSIEKFQNKKFFERFSEQEFLTNDPILTLFDMPYKISLSADKLVYNENEYNNFVYLLKPNTQTFSITDKSRGNMLATIDKDKTNYEIFTQLNQFRINGSLLSDNMPLNIRDTMITGELNFTTHGKIAHDIYYNLFGDIDLSFSKGYLIGMSFDDFYASAENITTLNIENALAHTLKTGETQIKNMRLIGTYDNGNFITTQPIELSMRHTNAVGGLAITNGKMTAEFDLTLRGTAPTPVTIELSILPDGGRNYSLSEIMQNLDTGFMRAFVKTHDKF